MSDGMTRITSDGGGGTWVRKAAPAPDQTDRGALVEALAGAVCECGHAARIHGTGRCGPVCEALAPTVAALMTEHAARVAGERDALRARVEAVPDWLAENGMSPQEVAFVRVNLRAALAGDGEGETGRSEALSGPLSDSGAIPGPPRPSETRQGAREAGGL